MKTSAVYVALALLLGAIVIGAAGCASDPDNDSARPWNAPQGYDSAMPIQNEQHSE
ncbi:MAG TPA: hypothetical protein VH280_13775 [Verrucomicrobiae bacterium]|jgi:hypothetical protein|nr:hypothetical protein [Verrucomicrobiae bacterium]